MADPIALSLNFSRPDSDRFGLQVFRASENVVDSRALLEAIVGHAADIVILRVPAGAHPELQRLGRYALHPIHADTLVYYQASLEAIKPSSPRNQDLEFFEAAGADAIELYALATAAFSGYVSHYHANPRLDPARILEGYAEWASSYFTYQQHGLIAWTARRQGVLLAFICCRYEPETKTCEVALNGVHPDHWRSGIYTDLLRYVQVEFRRRGYRSMRISTQIWNYAVQKVWSREGFSMEQAFDTFHLNAMLSAGTSLIERELVFNASGVLAGGVAEDDDKVGGYEDTTHRKMTRALVGQRGLIGADVSAIIASEMCLLGSEFGGAETALLQPILPGRAYMLQIRGLDTADDSGCIPTIATIRDSAGSLCLLRYSDLFKQN